MSKGTDNIYYISERQDLANLDLVLTLGTHRTILLSQLRMACSHIDHPIKQVLLAI